MICSFCLVPSQLKPLAAGPGVAICADCATGALDILDPDSTTGDMTPVGAGNHHTWTLADALRYLPEATLVTTQAENTIIEWVHAARDKGATWQQIGDALSITRQSAWERFSPSAKATPRSTPTPKRRKKPSSNDEE